MPDHVTTLLVGAGPMALAYAKVLRGLDVPFEVIGRGARSADVFAQTTGQRPVEGGLADFLSRRQIDPAIPVIVALPIPQLASATQLLIAAGARRLLVEKPAGLDLAEIDTLAAAACAAAADVFVAYNRRFYASVAAARALIVKDGGVSSFHIEFTELADRVATPEKAPAVLTNWLLGNSSHVIDLAFHLCGDPVEMNGVVSGSLPWHPTGAVFAGHGRTAAGALFTWHADWSSAGRWGLDLRTRRRRLLLQPLEKLQLQEKSGFTLSEFDLADRLDREYKPGLYRQVEAFLDDDPRSTGLPTIDAHAAALGRWLPAVTARPSQVSVRAVGVRR